MNKRFILAFFVSVIAPFCAMANVLDNSSERDGIADSSRVFDLDEIVVVSQPKEAFRLRRQPVSSSIFSSDELNSLAVRDLRELSSYVPSFVMPDYGSRLTSSMYIRGIGSRVNNPAVGMYVDGMPLVSKNSYNFHTYQLERVDVLRGPQGTLYGMNTEGGLVRMYSKNPMNYQGFDAVLGFGSHGYCNIESAVYRKLNDKFAMSIAAFYNGHNGFLRNATTGERADKFNESGERLRLVYNATNRLTLDYIADMQTVTQNGFAYGELNLDNNTVASPATNRQGNYHRFMFNTGLNVKYDANRFTFNSNTSYQHLSDSMLMDQDYMPQDYMHMEQHQLQNAITQEFTFKSKGNDIWKWTTGAYGSYQWLKTKAPVFFDKDFTDRISNAVQTQMYNAIYNMMYNKVYDALVIEMSKGMIAQGMSAAMAEAAAKTAAEKPAEAATRDAIEKAGGISMNAEMSVPALFHTPQYNIGVFHESNVKLGDKFTATIGLRYDYNHVKIDYDTNAEMKMAASVMGQEATNILTSVLQNKSDNGYSQLLPKFGLSYDVDDNGSNVYATVSKGYRAGGFNIQMFSDILQTELNENRDKAMRQSYDVPHTDEDYERIKNTIAYKPEESWNYEIGAHLNILGGKIQADVAAYLMQIRNQQLSVMAGTYGFGRMMVNAGKSRSLGVELALRGKALADRLSWSVTYGYTHSTFTEYKDSIDNPLQSMPNAKMLVDYKDNKVPYIPMHTIGANADYRLPLSCKTLRALTFGVNMNALGKIYWDEANTYCQNLYATLGAHADAELGKSINISLWAKNITNTDYNTFAFDSSASGQKMYFAQTGAPFQMGIDMRLHF